MYYNAILIEWRNYVVNVQDQIFGDPEIFDFFLFFRLGKYEKAMDAFTKALMVNPFFVNALVGRGNVLIENNESGGLCTGRFVNYIYPTNSRESTAKTVIEQNSSAYKMTFCK